MENKDVKLQILPQYFEMQRGGGWDQLNKPILVLDGQSQTWKPDVAYKAEEAFIVGTNDKNFSNVCRSLTAKTIYFYEMRVTDVSALTEISKARKIAINWNSKLSDLMPLSGLINLEALALINTPKANDLSFLSSLKNLRAFEFSGSPTLSSKNNAITLDPIEELTQLEELRLEGLTVRTGGLRPLAKCPDIKRLVVSNTFATDDFAYLAAMLPNTECRYFRASVPVIGDALGEGIDTMVVGKRKPFLNSKADAKRLKRYHDKFAQLKAKFSES